MPNSSLQQYIDLYEAHAPAVNAGSAPLLNALRPRALEALRGKRLPHTTDERSQHTSVEQMFAPDMGVNLQRLNLPVDVARSFACTVPHLSTLAAVVANDAFIPSEGLLRRCPEGVTLASLRQTALEHPALLEPFLGRIAPMDNPGVALNTLLAQDGVVVRIGRGVKLDKPLQVVNIFSSPTPLAAFRRLLIIMEEGAEASLVVCDHTQDATQDYLASLVTEVGLAPAARLGLYTLEEASARTSRYSQLYVRCDAGSRFTGCYAALSGGVSRSEMNVDLTGERAEALLAGGVIGLGERHVDCVTSVNHLSPRCHSNQVFRYVMDGHSTGAFDGAILVSPQAPFTEAYQSCRNVLASATARMHAKPRLEIYNDEVKASHGATVGQLDPTALFYMRSRGIPEQEAKVMLMQAFMADVVEAVELPMLRDRLRHLIDRRFAGEDSTSCRSCLPGDPSDNQPQPSDL